VFENPRRMSIVMQFTGRFMVLLICWVWTYRSNASVVDCRRSSSASCDCCRPETMRWRALSPLRLPSSTPAPAYRIGRLKIRMARTVNSALASSTARSQISYFLSYVRQRIHFGFVGGVSQLPHPLPPSWRFSIAARR
jgi:hypothetical protein